MNENQDIMGLLFRENPFTSYDHTAFEFDPSGWGSDDPNFKILIEKYHPALIIEVGTWKGGSAIHMAKLLKQANLNNSKIVCVDTFLGSLEFWTKSKNREEYFLGLNKQLDVKFGMPQVYFQFLSNVVYAQATDHIVPFPQTSSIAALWLKEKKIQAEMIYIDASHDKKFVLEDLENYWDLVKLGGILFGDDFSNIPGVGEAVQEFCTSKNLDFTVSESGRQWMIHKSA